MSGRAFTLWTLATFAQAYESVNDTAHVILDREYGVAAFWTGNGVLVVNIRSAPKAIMGRRAA